MVSWYQLIATYVTISNSIVYSHNHIIFNQYGFLGILEDIRASATIQYGAVAILRMVVANQHCMSYVHTYIHT